MCNTKVLVELMLSGSSVENDVVVSMKAAVYKG
jgi:hypothetical protein